MLNLGNDLHCQGAAKGQGKGLETNETLVGDRPVVAVECSTSCLESKSRTA